MIPVSVAPNTNDNATLAQAQAVQAACEKMGFFFIIEGQTSSGQILASSQLSIPSSGGLLQLGDGTSDGKYEDAGAIIAALQAQPTPLSQVCFLAQDLAEEGFGDAFSNLKQYLSTCNLSGLASLV